MIKTLFKDVAFGRIARLSYLGHSILLMVLLMAYMLIVVLAIGAGEHIIGGDLQQAQDQLRGMLTLPFLIITGIVMGLLMFAGLNIMAKRIRDIGLPGWWMVLAIIVLAMLLSYFVSQQAGSGLHTLIWLLLVLIPGNVVGKQP